MNDSLKLNDLLDAVAKILIRSFIGGMILLPGWMFLMVVGDDFAHRIHSTWFDISQSPDYTQISITTGFLVLC